MRNLSKSKIIAYRQCPKRLWLEVHRPDLRDDSESQAVFAIGNQVGEIARSVYDPEMRGVLVDVGELGHAAALNLSADLLRRGDQVIFEAGVSGDGALAYADVMIPDWINGEVAWKMIEIKSSTTVKDYHYDDIAVQTYIAKATGLHLTSVLLAHINRGFIYGGDGDYQGLFCENDLTSKTLSRLDEVRGWIAEAHAVAALPEEPNVETGAHCKDPFPCGFCNYCYRDTVSPEYPLSSIPRFSGKKKLLCDEHGIDDLRDVPDDWLSEKQHRVKSQTISQTAYIDTEGARGALAPYGFPALFLDFETCNMAIPIWKGTRPYEQIPFQFSLHTLQESGLLAHSAFLDLSGDDPTASFAATLVETCGEVGPIFVYNAKFERMIISYAARRIPALAVRLNLIRDRIVDLHPIAERFYYHPSQHGSWSIKTVLPAVCPDLRYEDLEGVQDGGGAVAAYGEAIHPETNPPRKMEIEQQLLKYCELDTFAMVRLWQVFSGWEVEIASRSLLGEISGRS